MSEQETVFAEERRRRILDALRERKRVLVSDLAVQFEVTPATIRSDLRAMERRDLLMRTHGEAVEKWRTRFEIESRDREGQNLDAKRRLAAAALELVQDGDTIILDTGTTTLELARLLSARRKLTVLTNDIVIAHTLEEFPGVEVVLMGGTLRKGFHCTVGTPTRLTTAGLTVDKAFLGTNSFSIEFGATTPDLQQAETKKHMLSIASKAIVLCDSTKLGKVSFAQYASASQIDTLVTDAIDAETRERLEQNGVEVLLATEPSADSGARENGQRSAQRPALPAGPVART